MSSHPAPWYSLGKHCEVQHLDLEFKTLKLLVKH